jgi:hypothetical protein
MLMVRLADHPRKVKRATQAGGINYLEFGVGTSSAAVAAFATFFLI